MIIALINWRILPDMEDDFLNTWKTELRLENAAGLIGEFLSRVEDSEFATAVTWEMEPDDRDIPEEWRSDDYVSYVNVGLWERYEDFHAALAKYMSQGRTLGKAFEAAPRRRAVLTVEHWRRGQSSLPAHTSPGVL
jgi:hypothetical protein